MHGEMFAIILSVYDLYFLAVFMHYVNLQYQIIHTANSSIWSSPPRDHWLYYMNCAGTITMAYTLMSCTLSIQPKVAK